MRILVVDDETDIQEIFRSVLEDEGHEVTAVGSGEAAAEATAAARFDLVFLDVKLPGKSGIDVLREIRAAHPDTRVVMVTGLLDDDVFDLAMFSPRPADGFLTKPCSFRAIQQCVRQVMTDDAPFIRTPRDEFHYLGAKLERRLEDLGLTVATAELLTAGALSEALGDTFRFDGAFRGGLALHGTEGLAALLPDADLPDTDALVSAETARTLARRVRERLGTDLGVGVVVLSDLYPHDSSVGLGTCFVAIDRKEGEKRLLERKFGPSRPELRRQAVYLAMKELLASLGRPLARPDSTP